MVPLFTYSYVVTVTELLTQENWLLGYMCTLLHVTKLPNIHGVFRLYYDVWATSKVSAVVYMPYTPAER